MYLDAYVRRLVDEVTRLEREVATLMWRLEQGVSAVASTRVPAPAEPRGAPERAFRVPVEDAGGSKWEHEVHKAYA